MWFNEIFLRHSSKDSKQDITEKFFPIHSATQLLIHTITHQHMVQALFFVADEHTYFYLLFGYLTANFALFFRGEPHSPNVKHCVIHSRHEGYHEFRSEVGSLNSANHLVGFEPGTFQFYHDTLTHRDSLPKNQFIKTFLVV